jgi:carboxyvinyl-carboxyphosphonate phosphorylmutase
VDWGKRRQRFRAILAGTSCVSPASVFDPLSSRIAEELGFEVAMLAGSVASLVVLGAPDMILLSATEFAEQAYRIGRASSLPLIVDADHGYGNALNVMRTVSELETAGVAALSIEDTALPTEFGVPKSHLISLDEAVGKLRAAVAGRQDPLLAILGRTNVTLAGVSEAVERVKAFSKTGVDAVFLTQVKTREQFEAVSSATDLPIILGGGLGDSADASYLARHRVRIALQSNAPVLAAAQAVYEFYKGQKAGKLDVVPVTSSELLKRLTNEERYKTYLKHFLGV